MSDSGKASLINGFVNFIVGVDLEDPFCFQLVDQSKVYIRNMIAASAFTKSNIRWNFVSFVRWHSTTDNCNGDSHPVEDRKINDDNIR